MAAGAALKTIQIVKSNLHPRKVRNGIGSKGIRKIDPYKLRNGKKSKGFFGNLFDGLTGWLSEKIGNFVKSINFQKIWDWIVNTTRTIYNFNWQQTDEEINKTIEDAWKAVETRMFGVLGRSMGYLVCGAVPAAVTASFNLPLAVAMAKELGEEAVSDLMGELGSFLSLSYQTTAMSVGLKAFSNVRKWIKEAKKNSAVKAIVSKFIDSKTIDDWGEQKGRQWSFASAVERKIESIPNEQLRNNIQEFLDEMSDSCVEAGYAIAGGMDEFFGLNAGNKGVFDLLGKERVIEYTPNKDVPSEVFALRGRQELVKQQIVDIKNTLTVIENREVGLNLPTEELDKIPVTVSNGIEIELEFFKFEQPPYWSKDRRKSNGRQRIRIANCNSNILTWNGIRTTWGQPITGKQTVSFDSGTYKVKLTWDTGRVTDYWVDSELEGERVAEILAKFSTAKIIYPLIIEKRKTKTGSSNKWEQQKKVKQYLAHIKVWNWGKITKFEEQKGTTQKTDKNLVKRLALHYERVTNYWDEEMRDAVKSTL